MQASRQACSRLVLSGQAPRDDVQARCRNKAGFGCGAHGHRSCVASGGEAARVPLRSHTRSWRAQSQVTTCRTCERCVGVRLMSDPCPRRACWWWHLFRTPLCPERRCAPAPSRYRTPPQGLEAYRYAALLEVGGQAVAARCVPEREYSCTRAPTRTPPAALQRVRTPQRA